MLKQDDFTSPVYSIRDNETGEYGDPMVLPNEIVATRTLGIALRDSRMQLSHYPQKFDLYEIGKYNRMSGKMTAIEPVYIVGAITVRQAMQAAERAQNVSTK